jgi:hypothetical protein
MMTLGNMRQHGVHSLAVYCGALWCHHQAVLECADDVTGRHSGRAWSVLSAAQSVRMRGQTGMNVRRAVCLDRASVFAN